MATNVKVEVTGVKEALRELNSMDKAARRKITREFKELVAPTMSVAEGLTPAELPMSGWRRKWDPQAGRQGGSTGRSIFPYQPMAARRAIKPFISGKSPKEFAGVVRNLAAMGITWKSPSAVQFDQANHWKTKSGAQMVATLRERYGEPSRVMWRAWERTEDDVIGNVKQLVEDMMFEVNGRLKVGL